MSGQVAITVVASTSDVCPKKCIVVYFYIYFLCRDTSDSDVKQIWKSLSCSDSRGKLNGKVHKPLIYEECPCLRPEDQDDHQKWIKDIRIINSNS